MLSTRFIPHSVELLAGPIWINQIDNTSPESGVDLIEESAGSETDTEFVAARQIKPTMAFSTSDLSVLTTVGFNGVALSNAGQTLAAYGRQVPFGGLPTALATAAHLKMTCLDGLLVPVSISAQHNQVARLNLMLHGGTASGGSATPFVFTANSAIPSGAGQVANVYTTGPVKWTQSGGLSTLATGINGLGVQFNLQVLKEGDSGEVYDSHISIIRRASKLEFSTKDPTIIAAIGDGISVSAFAMYFRQVSPNGQRVAPATATHVSVSGTAGMLYPGGLGLVHQQAGVAHFTYCPAKNTNLITISATAAIPTS